MSNKKDRTPPEPGQDIVDHCTCMEFDYPMHACPYAEELGEGGEDSKDDEEAGCNCCPYCTFQCAMDI